MGTSFFRRLRRTNFAASDRYQQQILNNAQFWQTKYLLVYMYVKRNKVTVDLLHDLLRGGRFILVGRFMHYILYRLGVFPGVLVRPSGHPDPLQRRFFPFDGHTPLPV